MKLDDINHTFFRALLTSLLVGALAATAVAAIDQIGITGYQKEKRHWAAKRLSGLRAGIEAVLNQKLTLARVIEITIQTDPDLDQTEFERLIRKLTAGSAGVDKAILVRNDLVSQVYPYDQSSLGRLPRKPVSESGALDRARKEKYRLLYGPLVFPSGPAEIFISHSPIFLDTDDNSKRERYWGFLELFMSRETLFEEFDLKKRIEGLELAVRRFSIVGSGQVMILGREEIFEQNPEKLTIKIPGGHWEIAAIPENGWPRLAPHSWHLRLFGVFLSFLAGLLVWLHVNSPVKLRQKIDQATRALREAQENLEQKIRERTIALEKANEVLSREIGERNRMEAELLAHVNYLENIERINKIIRPEADLEVQLGEVLYEIISIFDCDRAWLIYPCDPETPFWRLVMECNSPDYHSGLDIKTDIPTEAHMASAFQSALASEEPVISGTGGGKSVCSTIKDNFLVQSQVMLALYPRSDEPWLLGIHQCSNAREWSATDLTLFKEIGRKLSDVLEAMILLRSLKQSEEKFSGLLSRLNEAVFRATVPDLKFEYFSPAAKSVFGYECHDFISGRIGIKEIIHPDFSARYEAEMNKIAAGEVTPSFEYQIIDAEGKKRWVFQTNTGVVDQEGRVFALESCCIKSDRTETGRGSAHGFRSQHAADHRVLSHRHPDQPEWKACLRQSGSGQDVRVRLSGGTDRPAGGNALYPGGKAIRAPKTDGSVTR